MKRAVLYISTTIAFGGTVLMALNAPLAPPNTRVLDCTRGECHAAELNFKQLHGPVAANACDMCHDYKSAADHTFVLKREGARLCDFCHIGKTDQAGLNVHEPVQSGQCLECHDAHGSNTQLLLKADTPGETCMSCHAAIVDGMTSVHTAVSEGDCLGCHKAHSSMLPNLLLAEGRQLCMHCHQNVVSTDGEHPGTSTPAADASTPAANALTKGEHARVVHQPMLGECSQCHVTHASTAAPILKQQAEPLCVSCHADIADKIAGASIPHSAVAGDRACLNCHAPHQSEIKHLLKEDSIRLCLSCHEMEVKRTDGTIVASMKSLEEKHTSLHAPIDEGCAGCHDVHGGDHRALLVAEYTQSFYQEPNDPNAYALCFTCHDQKMLTEKSTTSATGFRNGDVNLHFLHVVEPGVKGRSCRVCHDTHASASPDLVNSEVPFGEWKIPINFKATDTGGSCGAGCHRPYEYDRGASE